MATPGYPQVSVYPHLNPLQNSSIGIPGEATPAFCLPYNRGPIVPTLITSWQQFTNLYGNFNVSNGSLLHYAVYQFFNNGGVSCFVLRIPNTDAVAATLNLDGIGSDISTPIMTVTCQSPGAWGDTVYVGVTPTGITGRFNFTVYNGGTASGNVAESFVDLSMNPADRRYIGSIVNSQIAGSAYVSLNVTLPGNTYILGQTDLAPTAPISLQSGNDGSIAPNLGTTAVFQFSQLDFQILNINLPGWTTASDINAIITWADSTNQSMVIIDPPFGGIPLETSAQVAAQAIDMTTIQPVITQSTNATIYSPWLNIVDPSSSVAGATVWVPPGGAVLGVWSNFLNLYGAEQTPAGINATVPANRLEATFTGTDLTNLQGNSINAIRSVRSTGQGGAGFCIMGGRTLLPGYPSQFISVQRVIQQFMHDFESICAYALFKPNVPSLWASVASTLTSYLLQQMQAGVLAGNTPSTAFYVICDASINSASSAQAGILYANVGVALASPAEYININLYQFEGATTTTAATS